MSTFIIKAEWLKKIEDGRNQAWNYDFKRYIFNDNYTDSYCICIPVGYGLKAMEYGNGRGIINEYNRVYLDNNGVITKLFDLDQLDEKDVQIHVLKQANAALKQENQELNAKLDAVFEVIGVRIG